MSRGFTMIEVVIAVVIMAIMMGVAIPTLENITRADLRAAASHTSGMIKGTYDTAVLEGKTCRLVFNLDKNTITPEITSDYVGLEISDGKRKEDPDDKKEDKKHAKGQADGKAADASGAKAVVAAVLDKDEAQLEKHDKDMSALLAIAKRVVDKTDGASKKPSFQALPGIRPYQMPNGVRLLDVMSEHLREPKKEGRAEIYFFPMGSTEHSLIHLQDDSDRVFSLELEPLTARTKIVDRRTEFKDDQ